MGSLDLSCLTMNSSRSMLVIIPNICVLFCRFSRSSSTKEEAMKQSDLSGDLTVIVSEFDDDIVVTFENST